MKDYHFYEIEGNKVYGWKNIGNQLVKTWTLEIPDTEKFLKSTQVYRGQPEANLPISNDKRVLFKNVDFSNIAILTTETLLMEHSENKTYERVHLYLINGVTGNLLFHKFQSYLNPNLPINLVYDEHHAIVTYYSIKNRVYEFWSIESYQLPQEEHLLDK